MLHICILLSIDNALCISIARALLVICAARAFSLKAARWYRVHLNARFGLSHKNAGWKLQDAYNLQNL